MAIEDIKIDISSPIKGENFYGPNIKGVCCIIGKNGVGKTRLLNHIVNGELPILKDGKAIILNPILKNKTDPTIFYYRSIIGNDGISFSKKNEFFIINDVGKIDFTNKRKNLSKVLYSENTLTKNISNTYYKTWFLYSFLNHLPEYESNKIFGSFKDLKEQCYLNFTPIPNVNFLQFLSEELTSRQKIILHRRNPSKKYLLDVLSNDEVLLNKLGSAPKILICLLILIINSSNTKLKSTFINRIISKEDDFDLNLFINEIGRNHIDFLTEIKMMSNPISLSSSINSNKHPHLSEFILNHENSIKYFFYEVKHRQTEDDFIFSSGDTAILDFISKLTHTYVQYAKSNKQKNKYLFALDEVDLAIHPERQKGLFKMLIECINTASNIARGLSVQRKFSIILILTSHSPFIVSDLPKINTTYIDIKKNKFGEFETIEIDKDRIENGFASDIHDIFRSSFFLHSGLVGGFAVETIRQNIINKLNTNLLIKDRKLLKKYILLIGDNLMRTAALEKLNNIE